MLLPTVSIAQDFADRDSREISSYVLTEAGLAKFTEATRNLGASAKKMSSECTDAEGPASLDAAVARLDAVPGAKAAITSAGMSTREYLVFTWSIFQNGMAAWALDQPGGKLPPGVAKANVDFYRSHEAAIKKLGLEAESDGCKDEDRPEDPENETQDA
jgi:hypothetical protein